jgi:predicted DCC family thiol-disulfide oxidoreductase YuxK
MSAQPADPSASSSAAPSADETPRAVTVFYDGACPLCSAEIGFYRRRRGADRVGWVDVSACQAENVTAGLTRDQALRRMPTVA